MNGFRKAGFAVAMLAVSASAEDALFIGNSFTYGGSEVPVRKFGGVPAMVRAIAASKGRALDFRMLAVSGKDWGFHLSRPVTDEALKQKPWNWVILQDFSTKPTRAGNLAEFLQNGGIFYHKVREFAPQARILLYETWARQEGHRLYGPAGLPGPAQMTEELASGYAKLGRNLEALDPEDQVALAPVGSAFAQCAEKYPGLLLYSADKYHAGPLGSYLAALVIYGAMFGDDPSGAIGEFPGFVIPPQAASQLQEVARGVLRETSR